MQRIAHIIEARSAIREWKVQGLSVGFVPTMGFLHEGHLSLVARARSENDRVVASIFVNPTQFGPQEDLDRYPRDEEGDAGKLATAGVDLLFLPKDNEIYPETFQTFVTVERVSALLCGRSRPGHFRGVATVVAKLFNIAQPDRAYFGAKDYQQTVIIRTLVRDLNIPTEVVICPTVRENDGLAMSSRNAYLSPEERRAALVLFRSLSKAAEMLEAGGQTRFSVETLRSRLASAVAAEPLAALEYAEVVDAETLEPLRELRGPVLMALAVKIGTTRLIDNIVVNLPASVPQGA